MNNNKIICVIGKAAVGKDTFVNELLKDGQYRKAISYTTRPKRAGEIDGKDYYFISLEEFNKMKDNNEFLEETSYIVNGETWYYGFAKDTFENLSHDLIAIVNPRGLECIVNEPSLRNNIVVMYMQADEMTRAQRYKLRDSALDKETLQARWNARVLQDLKDFKAVGKLLADNNVRFLTFNTTCLNKQEMFYCGKGVIKELKKYGQN